MIDSWLGGRVYRRELDAAAPDHYCTVGRSGDASSIFTYSLNDASLSRPAETEQLLISFHLINYKSVSMMSSHLVYKSSVCIIYANIIVYGCDADECPPSQAMWLQQSEAGSWGGEDALPQRSQWVNEAHPVCVYVWEKVQLAFTCTVEGSVSGRVCTSVCVCVTSGECDHKPAGMLQPCWQRTHKEMIYILWQLHIFDHIFLALCV